MIDMSGMADKITSLHHWKRQGKDNTKHKTRPRPGLIRFSSTLSTPPPSSPRRRFSTLSTPPPPRRRFSTLSTLPPPPPVVEGSRLHYLRPPPLPPVAYLKFSDASRLINSFLPLRLPTHYETPLSFLAMMNLTAPLPYPDSIRQNPHFRLYDLDPAVDFTPTNLNEAIKAIELCGKIIESSLSVSEVKKEAMVYSAKRLTILGTFPQLAYRPCPGRPNPQIIGWSPPR